MYLVGSQLTSVATDGYSGFDDIPSAPAVAQYLGEVCGDGGVLFQAKVRENWPSCLGQEM